MKDGVGGDTNQISTFIRHNIRVICIGGEIKLKCSSFAQLNWISFIVGERYLENNHDFFFLFLRFNFKLHKKFSYMDDSVKKIHMKLLNSIWQSTFPSIKFI